MGDQKERQPPQPAPPSTAPVSSRAPAGDAVLDTQAAPGGGNAAALEAMEAEGQGAAPPPAGDQGSGAPPAAPPPPSGGGPPAEVAPEEAPPAEGRAPEVAPDAATPEADVAPVASGAATGEEASAVAPAGPERAPAAPAPQLADPAAASGTGSTGLDEVDAFLNDNADDVQLAALTEASTPWYDHPVARGAENVLERLIPVYGAYDAVRDSWNRQGDMVEMAPPLLESPGAFILHICMGLSNLFGAVSGVLRHVAYLVSLCQWLATFSAVADGPIGPIVGAIAGIGGEACNILAMCVEFCAFCANLLTTIVAVINALCTDDPTNRLRYLNIGGMAMEGMLMNAVNMVLDFAALATWNMIPSGVTSEVARKVLEAFAKTGVRFMAQGFARWGLRGTTGMGADWDYTQLPTDEQGRPMKTYEWPHLSPRLLHASFLFWGAEAEDGAVVLNTTEGPVASSASATLVGPMLARDSRATGGASPAGGGEVLPPVDHSPAQVAALGQLEDELGRILVERQESRAALEEHRDAHAENVVLAEQGEGQVAAQTESREGMLDPLATAQTGLTDGVDQAGRAGTHLGEVQGQLGVGAQQFANIGGLSMPQVPQQEEEGLLDRAVRWASQQALDLAFSRASGAMGAAQGAAGAQQGQATATGAEAGAAAGMLTGFTAQLQGALGINAQVGADTQGALAGLATQEGQLQQARGTSETQVAEAEAGIAEEDAEIAELEALVAEVRAERARQEQANAAFAARHGADLLSMQDLGGTEQGPPVQDSDADMLLSAFDAVDGLSDGAVSEAFARAGAVPDGASDAALDLVSQLQSSQEATLAEAMTLVNAAVGQVGVAGPAAWAAVDAARQALLDAEVSTRMGLAHVLAVLDQLAAAQAPEGAAAEHEAPAEQPAVA